jgi:hypothetical protein
LSSNSITDSDWHHVIGTNDGTTARLYIDGIERGTDTTPATTLWDNSANLTIGAETKPSNNNVGRHFDGTIDEVVIFNRSLSADEVETLYETSAKKLTATGTQSIAAKTSPAIVLANPAGTTKFDDVKVSRDRKAIKLVVPYDNIDINGTLRAARGDYKIQIRHVETNATLNKPTIEITAV